MNRPEEAGPKRRHPHGRLTQPVGFHRDIKEAFFLLPVAGAPSAVGVGWRDATGRQRPWRSAEGSFFLFWETGADLTRNDLLPQKRVETVDPVSAMLVSSGKGNPYRAAAR